MEYSETGSQTETIRKPFMNLFYYLFLLVFQSGADETFE